METVAQRVDRLEQVMIELAEQSKITQREVARLSIEMRAFKDEMNKRWGDLANKMGTLVEDIFIPSFDIMLKRYFGVTPKRISSRMKLRNENREIELDIVGFTEDKVFIVEVKSSPDRQGYIDDFIEKLRVLPEFLPEIKSYEVVPIYAGLTMSESTIESLTKNNIYALIVRGDILEIVNFDKVKKTEG
jgi:hypothetical protein